MKKLLALVAVGVAIKYFLDTEKGKQLSQQVKDWLGEAQDSFNDIIDQTTGKIEKTANQIDRAAM